MAGHWACELCQGCPILERFSSTRPSDVRRFNAPAGRDVISHCPQLRGGGMLDDLQTFSHRHRGHSINRIRGWLSDSCVAEAEFRAPRMPQTRDMN
ncbi:hypothetical protein PsYK624_125570 [Phanerochaete sordida]|uniref:Uncharacterized protein n=1 Tax=Phanerochaete sordida TaxID=48140 RepID=A0A9P3GJK3_9APHY|nr:hypothetical protein PsYK624_125570 [Phanerochaete sordida]